MMTQSRFDQNPGLEGDSMKVPTVGISHPTIIVRNLMHLLMTKSTAPAKMMRAATGTQTNTRSTEISTKVAS
jgi:hypothetical protein